MEAIHSKPQPDAGQNKEYRRDQTQQGADVFSTPEQRTFGFHLQPGGAMVDKHDDGKYAYQQGKGIEQTPEAAGVVNTQQVIKMKGYALQQVAKSHTNNQRRHGRAHRQRPVPAVTPGLVVDF